MCLFLPFSIAPLLTSILLLFSPYDDQGQPFGEVYVEFTCRSWVHSVAWCPSGRTLAYAGHDSTIHIVSFPRPGVAPIESIISLQGLPANVLSFVSDKAIIAGGHDFNPFIITGQ